MEHGVRRNYGLSDLIVCRIFYVHVTNTQKGQQGPAMTIGEPSGWDKRANMCPILLAQQQQKL
jgi:hypothetical protein